MKLPPVLDFALHRAVFAVRDALRPRANILAEVGLRRGFRVLDYGCGPGGYLLPLLRFIGPEGKAFALDANSLAVRRVKRLARRKGIAHVEAILSDGPTGLPDDSIDRVLLYDTFHILSRPAEVLRELHRVLRPEGALSFRDHHMSPESIVAAVTKGGLFRLSGKGRYTYTFAKVTT